MPGFVGAVLAPLTLMLGYDLGGVCGGLSRRVKFRPLPGTITCADYPAPISGAGVCNMPMVVSTATGATAKMVACAEPPLRDKALGIADVHAYGGWIFNGINQHGQFFMAMHSGMAPGAIPASPGRDGIDTGGQDWVPGMEASNVEDNEMSWPVLTLFRRENRADAAGAGLYRSGVGAEEAWIIHGTDTLDTQVYNNESFVKCQGLLGGNPGGRAFFRVKRGTDVAARLAQGTIPQSVDEVSGEEIPLYWKGMPVQLDTTSVWTLNLPNFAGYGDPLDRDPAAVSRDIAGGQDVCRRRLPCVRGGRHQRWNGRRREDQGGTGGSQKATAGGWPTRPRSPRPRRAARGLRTPGDQPQARYRPDVRWRSFRMYLRPGSGSGRGRFQGFVQGEGKPGRLDRPGVSCPSPRTSRRGCASGSSSARGAVRAWGQR